MENPKENRVFWLTLTLTLSETVSKLRRDELHESPIVRKSPKKSGTRVTRPSELKVLRQSHSPGPQERGQRLPVCWIILTSLAPWPTAGLPLTSGVRLR